MPFIFSSETGTGVNIDLTPLNSIKYFLIEINMIIIPGKIKKRIAKYFIRNDFIRIGLSKEY